MRITMMIASAAMSVASGCAALPPPSDTNGNCVAVVSESTVATNMSPHVVVTNITQTVESKSDEPVAKPNVHSVGTAPRAVRGGRGATALPGFAIASDINSNVCDVVCAKILYPDVPPDEFSADDWAEELAEKAEQGLHIRNGQILVVARIPAIDGEYQSLTKVRAKSRAVEFLRHHYPDLRKEFSAPCRVLVSEQPESSGECVVVMSFTMQDIALQGK